MIDLIDFFQAGILCGLLTIYLLVFNRNAFRSYSNYVLAAFIFLQCWTAAAYVLIITGAILEVPHFFKTAAPINFLIPPLGYLYVRSVLFNEKKWTGKDLFHLLPFALFLISYLPFFLSSSEYKSEVIEESLQNQQAALIRPLGLLPESIFYYSRAVQAIIYLVVQWWIILKFNMGTKDQAMESQIHRIVRWLKIYTAANTGILLGFLVAVAFYLFQLDIFDESFFNFLPSTLLGCSFFLICAYLLIHPQVVIGLPFVRKKAPNSVTAIQETQKATFCVENYVREITVLDEYFASSKAYLQPNLSISEVAVATGIPNRDLSYLINSYHKKRFNDFLNEMRLRHFLIQVSGTTLDTFTIEAIALDAGFSSKSAFYRSFNRFYGCTPLEFLRTGEAEEQLR